MIQGEQLHRETAQGLSLVTSNVFSTKDYEANKLENYVYYFFFARSANAYVFSAHDREDKDFLLAQAFRDNILLEYI